MGNNDFRPHSRIRERFTKNIDLDSKLKFEVIVVLKSLEEFDI